MKRARFVAAARREFLAEVIHYAKSEAALGTRFARAVEGAVALALAFPRAGSPAHSNIDPIVARGFAVSIYYRPEANGIVVVADAHHARSPGYWASRVGAD